MLGGVFVCLLMAVMLGHCAVLRPRETRHIRIMDNPNIAEQVQNASSRTHDSTISEDPVKNKTVKRDISWPGGIVPYTIDMDAFAASEVAKVLSAMRKIERHSCVRFVPRKDEEDYVYIKSTPKGCFSSLGRAGGQQPLNLETICFHNQDTPLHELMHAIGVRHEHTRTDRDNYITVHQSNIKDGRVRSFDIDPNNTGLGTPYDLRSVMHYKRNDFSNNGKSTISPRACSIKNLSGRRCKLLRKAVDTARGLSFWDKKKIRNLYHCSEYNITHQ